MADLFDPNRRRALQNSPRAAALFQNI